MTQALATTHRRRPTPSSVPPQVVTATAAAAVARSLIPHEHLVGVRAPVFQTDTR